MAAKGKANDELGPEVTLPGGSKLTDTIRDLVRTGNPPRPHRMDEFASYTGASVEQITEAFERIALEDGTLLTEALSELLLVDDFDEPARMSPLEESLGVAMDAVHVNSGDAEGADGLVQFSPRGGSKKQPSMFDRTVESSELEAALVTMDENHAAHKRWQKARSLAAPHIEAMKLKDGERVRVGNHVVIGKRRSGGGFEVPNWDKVTVGKITRLADE